MSTTVEIEKIHDEKVEKLVKEYVHTVNLADARLRSAQRCY